MRNQIVKSLVLAAIFPRAQSSCGRCKIKWFKHDSDAHRDAKLKKVVIKYGMAGYGLYWYCLEEIANGVSESKFTFELESDAEIISHDTGISTELVNEMMAFMVDLGLFENNANVLTCLKMLHRLDTSMTSNKHMRDIITKAKSCQSHDAVMIESCKSRVDKSRVDKDKTIRENSTSSSPAVKVPYQDILDLYHSTLPEMRKVEKLTETRKRYIKNLWHGDLPDLDHWNNFFNYIRRSDFLMGRTAPGYGRSKPFVANLEWITKPANYVKIYEDQYHQ